MNCDPDGRTKCWALLAERRGSFVRASFGPDLVGAIALWVVVDINRLNMLEDGEGRGW